MTADLVISFTTTALQAALRKIDRKPLLFALVLDPFAAGAGKSDTDHRANVTGVYLAFPLRGSRPHHPRGFAQGAASRHPLHARRAQLRDRPATVRECAQEAGTLAREHAGELSVRGE